MEYGESCMCLCKDTNFKANHNLLLMIFQMQEVVCAYAKILILKQITTGEDTKRQHYRCMCLCKDTNFKANHNPSHSPPVKNALYVPMQRY